MAYDKKEELQRNGLTTSRNRLNFHIKSCSAITKYCFTEQV